VKAGLYGSSFLFATRVDDAQRIVVRANARPQLRLR
jgi:hypothetical protein